MLAVLASGPGERMANKSYEKIVTHLDVHLLVPSVVEKTIFTWVREARAQNETSCIRLCGEKVQISMNKLFLKEKPLVLIEDCPGTGLFKMDFSKELIYQKWK